MKDSDSASGKDFDDSKIYCANCIHCKVIKTQTQNEGEYQLRVRCDAGMWKKKMGDEKYYKYFTVIRRKLDQCDAYESMGDEEEYLKDFDYWGYCDLDEYFGDLNHFISSERLSFLELSVW